MIISDFYTIFFQKNNSQGTDRPAADIEERTRLVSMRGVRSHGLTEQRMTSFVNKKILVADDSQTMRMFLLFHLIKMLPGVGIREAVNGADALEKLKAEDVDLVLTDMNMPEMDGAGLIAAVREELKRDVPIIIITTRGEERDRQRGLSLGANGYITKPLNIREFRETIFRFLRRRE